MKSKLNYVISVIFCLSLGITFMPIVRISVVKVSLSDIFLSGLGNKESLLNEVEKLIEVYIMPYSYIFYGLVFLILLGACFSAMLPNYNAYYAAIILGIINNIAAGVLYFGIKGKIDSIKKAFSFFNFGSGFSIYYSTVFLWCFSYFLIIALAIAGIILINQSKTNNQDEIMLESCNMGGNPWKDHQEFTVKQEQKYIMQSRELEEWERQPSKNSRERKGANQNTEKRSRKFDGAIEGKSGAYFSKIYPLRERQQFFFSEDENKIFLTEKKEGNTLSGIYYIDEYEDYCLEVLKKNMVYLISGQPLGMGRTYYLPRGTEIYIKNEEYSFWLL